MTTRKQAATHRRIAESEGAWAVTRMRQGHPDAPIRAKDAAAHAATYLGWMYRSYPIRTDRGPR